VHKGESDDQEDGFEEDQNDCGIHEGQNLGKTWGKINQKMADLAITLDWIMLWELCYRLLDCHWPFTHIINILWLHID
jgi:hypothetical protein